MTHFSLTINIMLKMNLRLVKVIFAFIIGNKIIFMECPNKLLLFKMSVVKCYYCSRGKVAHYV